MAISNPVRVFVTGNATEKFTYEGGKNLYHFCPKDNGISTVYDCNIVLFADSVEHANSVLVRMFTFMVNCYKKYQENTRATPDRHGFQSEASRKIGKLEYWIEALQTGKAGVEHAPRDQVYLVGWADNDTVI